MVGVREADQAVEPEADESVVPLVFQTARDVRITLLIDRLEAKGVVVRQSIEGDRRSISIELTASGLAIVKKAAPTMQGVHRQLLKGFTSEEVRNLTGMLRRLRENAKGLSK